MEAKKRNYLNNSLLVKYLRRELSTEETDEVSSWLKEDKANQDFLFGLEELYLLYQWDELKLQANTDEQWCKLEKEIRAKKRSTRFGFPVIRKAVAIAAIFIGLLVGGGMLFRQMLTTDTPTLVSALTNRGEHSQLILPDGSKVWLNADTKVVYSSSLSSGRRLVNLSGEAYFEVKRDPEHPFVVQTNTNYSVEVLGTVFNVSAYDDEEQIETTLVSGSVKLTVNLNNGKTLSKVLKPDERSVYTKNKDSIVVSAARVDDDVAWKDGCIVFRNESMQKVLKKLEKYYSVHFDVKDSSVLKSVITAKFNNKQLHQVLESLSVVSEIRFKEIKDDSDLNLIEVYK